MQAYVYVDNYVIRAYTNNQCRNIAKILHHTQKGHSTRLTLSSNVCMDIRLKFPDLSWASIEKIESGPAQDHSNPGLGPCNPVIPIFLESLIVGLLLIWEMELHGVPLLQ